MSTPVIIRHDPPVRGHSNISLGSYGSSDAASLMGCSPSSALAYQVGSLGVAGASPPYRGASSSAAAEKANPYLAAKKFWKRLCFDPALDPTEYTIGFIETVQQPERKSGVEAWSMRLHDRLLELPYNAFVERFCGSGYTGFGGGDGTPPTNPRHASPSGAWVGLTSTSEESASDVPYHRIAYFKHGNTVVWESEYHKRRLNDLPPVALAHFGAPPTSDGGGGGISRRRSSREGMPPMPSAAPSWLSSGGGSASSLHPRGAVFFGGPGAGGTLGASGRSPRGACPLAGGSDDGLDGATSEDGDMLLLEEEEEEQHDEDNDDVEEAPLDCDVGSGGSAATAVQRLLLAGGILGVGGGRLLQGTVQEAPEQQHRQDEEVAMPQLPEECWMAMLQLLGVRDVCMVGRTCRWLRQLASDPAVWRAQHQALWGSPPDLQVPTAAVRRKCRRSQLRAARWLEAHVRGATMGFASTTCLQMDESKVVSGDGNVVRLWSHVTGRRIATLQGHPGRVTAVAFDEALLISGCAGAVVKLWSMDELRCRRTLRHEGAVTACCLLPTGIPVSGAEDGLIRLWDVASGSSIVALEAGHPVLALQAHAPSDRLVAAAGWGVQLWDVSTATLLHTLGASVDGDTATGGAAVAQHPYTCVSYMGDLLAAGRQGEVVLLDPRVAAPVGRLRCDVRGSGGAAAAAATSAGGMGTGTDTGMGTIAAAAAAGVGRGAPCVGVQLDEWKLVCGFNDGRHQLNVYDIRALTPGQRFGTAGDGGGGGGTRRPWQLPLMTLTAPARVNAFQFHEQALLAGLEGTDCIMWRFESPNAPALGTAAAAAVGGTSRGSAPMTPGGLARAGGAGGAGSTAGGGGGSQAGTEGGFADMVGGGGGGRKEKKKPAKVAKKQTRYPKRNTK